MQTAQPGIRLLVYAAEDDDHIGRLLSGWGTRYPRPTLCRKVEEIGDALKGVLSGYGILVAAIREMGELERLACQAERLRDHTVIFIVEDGRREMMSRILKFFPRYITNFEGDYSDLFQVMENMLTKIKAKGE